MNNKVIAVIGSRDFTDYRLLEQTLNKIKKPYTMVSGGAKGADSLAGTYAKLHNIPITVIYPDWNTYGRSAGFRRNHDIIAQATHVIAFQINNSRGTQHSIDLALAQNKPVKVFNL